MISRLLTTISRFLTTINSRISPLTLLITSIVLLGIDPYPTGTGRSNGSCRYSLAMPCYSWETPNCHKTHIGPAVDPVVWSPCCWMETLLAATETQLLLNWAWRPQLVTKQLTNEQPNQLQPTTQPTKQFPPDNQLPCARRCLVS